MFDYGFENLKISNVTEAKKHIGTFTVKNGEKTSINAVYEKTFSLPVLKNDVIEEEIVFCQKNTAPIKKGAVIGYATIKLNNKKIKTINIVANEACRKIRKENIGSVFNKMIKSLF